MDRYHLQEALDSQKRRQTLVGQDIETGEPVRVRVIKSELLTAAATARFEYEASIRQRLQNRWLTPVTAFTRDAEHIFLVMPHVQGIGLIDDSSASEIDCENLGSLHHRRSYWGAELNR